jgi:putative hemolysin
MTQAFHAISAQAEQLDPKGLLRNMGDHWIGTTPELDAAIQAGKDAVEAIRKIRYSLSASAMKFTQEEPDATPEEVKTIVCGVFDGLKSAMNEEIEATLVVLHSRIP